MRISCVSHYRDYLPGDMIVGQISEDALNFYWHGVSDEHPTGFHSNYLTLPKYAFAEVAGLKVVDLTKGRA